MAVNKGQQDVTLTTVLAQYVGDRSARYCCRSCKYATCCLKRSLSAPLTAIMECCYILPPVHEVLLGPEASSLPQKW